MSRCFAWRASIVRRSWGPLLVLALTAVILSQPAAADTVVGRTLGSFAVPASGAATYAIPIFTPPGPQGLQPNIALTYDSHQGNGYVGVGWTVSGLSSIYRCNRTIAQDGIAAAVDLTNSDGLCMDGPAAGKCR